MSKRILYFALGQLLQVGILAFALTATYVSNVLLFCAVLGAVGTGILCFGMGIERVEQAERDMEETAPLPEEITVTNDKVEKIPEPPTTGSDAEHHPKHIKITVSKPTTLMEKALAAVGMEEEK